jgi:hypothetical protein
MFAATAALATPPAQVLHDQEAGLRCSEVGAAISLVEVGQHDPKWLRLPPGWMAKGLRILGSFADPYQAVHTTNQR